MKKEDTKETPKKVFFNMEVHKILNKNNRKNGSWYHPDNKTVYKSSSKATIGV